MDLVFELWHDFKEWLQEYGTFKSKASKSDRTFICMVAFFFGLVGGYELVDLGIL